MGFGLSRAQARQMIRHGHITVNGQRVDIPSYMVRVGDVIRVKNRAKSLRAGCRRNLAEKRRDVPDFLSRIDGPDSRRRRRSACPRPTTFRSRSRRN